jgi:hypothetical protein
VALDPKRVTYTINYPGGTMTATLGMINAMMGTVVPVWNAVILPPKAGSNRRRRSYATTQRSAAKGGRNVIVKLADGTEWLVRVTGAMLDFESFVLNKIPDGRVFAAYTARGSKYGPTIEATP